MIVAALDMFYLSPADQYEIFMQATFIGVPITLGILYAWRKKLPK